MAAGCGLTALAAWVRAAPAQTEAALAAAARYSAEREGDAVLVFRHDSLVLEDYQNGYDGRAPHPLASGTKTLSCVIAALAVADGLLRLDEPLARALPEFRADSLKARITLRQLLSLTSGLQPDFSAPTRRYADALALPMVSASGTRFAYGAAPFHIFGELMHRTLGGDVAAYLRRRVLAPLGIAVAYWLRDTDGRPHLAGGAMMTARDWGVFGLLLLHRGSWRGRQIVPAAGLAECRRGSPANAGYGLGLWLNAPLPTGPAPPGVQPAGAADRRLLAPDLPADISLAAGAAGQRLYVLPTPGLVIVRLGHNSGPEFKDDAFLRLALGKR
jgi:CubicO group peptidase (beta-lactamase class C family)